MNLICIFMANQCEIGMLWNCICQAAHVGTPTNVLTLANWKRTRYQVIWLPSGIYGITFKARDCQLECKNWNPLPVCACPKSLLQTYVDPSPFTDDMCAFCTGYNESANKSLHTCDAWQEHSTRLVGLSRGSLQLQLACPTLHSMVVGSSIYLHSYLFSVFAY